MSGRRRLSLALAWLAIAALVAPSGPVAIEPTPNPAPPPPAEPPPPEAAEPAVTAEQAPAPAPVIEQAPEPSPIPEPAPPLDPPAEAADPPPARAAASGSVSMRDFSFAPGSVTVNVGDSVTWRNDGAAPHSATAGDGSFDTGLLDGGQSGSATFGEAGTIAYVCSIHPSMTGTVEVLAAASGDTPVSSDDDPDTTGTADGAAPAAGQEAAAESGPSLPSTGAEAAWIAVTGAGLLLIGFAGRRRTRSDRS